MRLRMGHGFPDFLAAWLVVISFYGEGTKGILQVAWIGLMHGFPSQPQIEAVLAVALFLVFRSQRFHLGRDGWLPRTIGVALACLVLCLPELVVMDMAEWRSHAKLLATYGLVSGTLSWPLFAIGRRWGAPMGLRPAT